MARGSGVNRKGRSKRRGRFVRISYDMAISPAWRSLSGPAVKYYIELRGRFNGINNGELHLSFAEAVRLLHIGKATVKRVQHELEEKGFIHKMRPGSWYNQLATTWAITDVPRPGQPATNAWKNWRP